MPGIHVRTLGRLHWEDRDKEPTLTVPGSYWLCHKNNIYKFTFKFHKTIRNTTEFSYSKELMKIIRRVIKWQPRQGQHFSTKNLLVTYNHASWTRQDKMFAVMKFCDRPDAIAFPHAFILTVKLLNQEQSQQKIEEAMGGLMSKTVSDNPTLSSLADDPLPDLPAPFLNSSKDKEETVAVLLTNGRLEKEGRSLRSRSRHKEPDSPRSTNSPARPISGEKEEVMSGSAEGKEDVTDSSNVLDMDSEWRSKSSALEAKTVASDSQENNIIDQDEDSNSSSGADSASLPYQYLIEKDIERELENSRNAKLNALKQNDVTSVNGLDNPCDSSFNNDFDDSKSSRDFRKSNKLKGRQESKDKESIVPPEVANLRSSDITDLVMKGLMFTIRQDKDTVTVVEQKTKLEVDEVLENSEKVETKEGDPCLLNSSLLRLEKMITRMQQPISLPESRHNGLSDNALVSFMDLANEINIETERKLNMADVAERKDACPSTPALETANCWAQFFGDKEISNSSFENIEKVLGDSSMYISDENQDEDMELRIESEEEEDIIPEALVHQTFFNNTLDAMSKTPTIDGFQDLLMDDNEPLDDGIIDVEEIGDQSDCALKLIEDNLNKDSSKLPKIISNQIITPDQIPPAILKVLKNKATNQQTHSDETNISNNSVRVSENNNKIDIKNIENKIENNNKEFVETNIENNVQDIKEDNMQNSIKIDIVKNNIESYNVTTFENNEEVSSQSSPVCNSIKDEKSQKTSVTKSNDISTSNSNSVDNIRLTRSNSKLYEKSSETSRLNTSNLNLQKSDYSMDIWSQKILDKSSEVLNNKTTLRQTRKRSTSGSEKKEVKIKVQKLINDLKYGVKVVVQRIDVLNTPR